MDARQDDHGVRRFYLCTRQYAQVKDDPAARKVKKGRLGRYRRLFADGRAAARTGLDLSTPSTDNSGANESNRPAAGVPTLAAARGRPPRPATILLPVVAGARGHFRLDQLPGSSSSIALAG